MAPRSLWSALPLFLLLAPSLAVENDFSFYPSGARSCLYDAADAAGCTSGSIAALNTCLCGNNNDFVINTAKCLGEKDSGDVDSVYDTMSNACSTSSTPLSVSKSDFQDAASGASSGTTAAASSTEAASSTQAASSTSSDSVTTTASNAVVTQSAYTTTIGGSTVTVIPTQTQTSAAGSGSSNDNSSGLSTTATIGVGVGAAVAGAGIVGAIVFFVLRRRRRRDEEQAHPILLQHQQGTPQNPSPFAPPPAVTPAMTFSSDAQSHSNWTGGTSPSPASMGWNKPDGVSPQYPQYNTPGQAHLVPGGVPQMQQVQPQVFEMDSSQTVVPPVEMPGSAVQR